MNDDFYRRPFGNADSFQAKEDRRRSRRPRNNFSDNMSEDDEKTVKRSFSKIGISLFVFNIVAYAVIIISQIVIQLAFPDKAEAILSNTYTAWILNIVSMYMIAFPVLYAIIRKMPKVDIPKSKLGADEFFLFFLIAEGVMMMGNMIGVSLNSIIGNIIGRPIDNSVSELIESSPIWIITLVVVIVGPIVEELIFRKLLIDRLSVFGSVTAVIVSSLAFGLFHGNLYQFFYAAGIGLVLGYIYARTGNIKYTLALHMIINFIGSVLAIPISKIAEEFLQLSEMLSLGESVDMSKYILYSNIVASYTVVEYGMAIAGIVILVKKLGMHTIYLSNSARISIAPRKAFKLTVLNVGIMLFLIGSLAQFALSIFG